MGHTIVIIGDPPPPPFITQGSWVQTRRSALLEKCLKTISRVNPCHAREIGQLVRYLTKHKIEL